MKKLLLASIFCMTVMTASGAFAQNAFWTFDETNREASIPPQCDGQFDEARGGVFMPTAEELFIQGEAFLGEKGSSRPNAGYCLLAAALQGHVGAQYRLAQLYNKGIVLPQNDLIAYKWAFIASMNGNKEAERLALMMEQFLSTEDVQLATASIQAMLPEMLKQKQETLNEKQKILEDKQIELEKINSEIDAMLGVNFKSDVIPGRKQLEKKKADEKEKITGDKKDEGAGGPNVGEIFSEEDRPKS